MALSTSGPTPQTLGQEGGSVTAHGMIASARARWTVARCLRKAYAINPRAGSPRPGDQSAGLCALRPYAPTEGRPRPRAGASRGAGSGRAASPVQGPGRRTVLDPSPETHARIRLRADGGRAADRSPEPRPPNPYAQSLPARHSRRAAEFQFRCRQVESARVPGAFEAVQEAAGGAAADLVARVVDRGQPDVPQAGDARVVVADDGDVVRDAQSELLGGRERADGRDVVDGEEGGWSRRAREQPDGGAVAALLGH